ncbi:MAG: hypothetical protein QXD48_02585 [Candidatus Aenigmatarchaeota archaeon]
MKRRDLFKYIIGSCLYLLTNKDFSIKVSEYPKIGFTFTVWNNSNLHTYDVIKRLIEIGIKDISIHIPWYQDFKESTEIHNYKSGVKATPDDKYIKELIYDAKENNMCIMIKPCIYVLDKNTWHGEIEPKDKDKWFKSYSEIILHYVNIAKKHNIEIFCIGNELTSMEKYVDRWEALIKDIRKSYNGKLTYGANYNSYENVRFFDKLDYIGISAYFPLRFNKEELIDLNHFLKSWKFHNKKISEFSKNVKKPVIFTEIGYRSISGTSLRPYDYKSKSEEDKNEQAICYRALVMGLLQKLINVEKVYIWSSNDGNTLKENDSSGYGIFNKPAEHEIFFYHFDG